MMGSVFAMQGIGQFAAGIMSLIVTSGFKQSLLTADAVNECSGVCGIAVDKMWRIIIGFGAVPGCIALYYRLTIPETPRYTFDVSRDVVKGGSDVKAYLSSEPEGHPDEITRVAAMQDAAPRMEIPKASWSDFCTHYGQWKYGKVLLGTAGSWFFLDVAFYGVGLNNATILTAIGYAKGANVYQTFFNRWLPLEVSLDRNVSIADTDYSFRWQPHLGLCGRHSGILGHRRYSRHDRSQANPTDGIHHLDHHVLHHGLR
jgi:PHS family inorganic phosphate transporter-like MFS transporter